MTFKIGETWRGFRGIWRTNYAESDKQSSLIQESSAIDDDGLQNPGSSFLWIGDNHHLNRDEVQELIEIMQYWIDNKRLPEPEKFKEKEK